MVGSQASDRFPACRAAAATALGYYFRHDHALYLGGASVALLAVAQWQSGFVTMARSIATHGALAFLFVLPHLAHVQWAAGIPTYRASRACMSAANRSPAARRSGPVRECPRGTLDLARNADRPRQMGAQRDDRVRARLEDTYKLDVVTHVE